MVILKLSMRLVYSLVWWLAMPAVLMRLWWRGRKEPGYRRYWLERLGSYSVALPTVRDLESTGNSGTGSSDSLTPALKAGSPAVGQRGSLAAASTQSAPLIWLHAVSVGETRAAEPLIRALLQAWPDHAILLSHMTPTGRSTGTALFRDLGPRLIQSYLPYDTGWMTACFLRYFSPRLGILMETEVWPNLLAQSQRQHIPMVLANARLSERSLRKAQRFSAVMREAARQFALVAAQTAADARRLESMGAAPVEVTGSLKFDVIPSAKLLAQGAAWRQQFGKRPVLLCASTRDGEEALILQAFAAMLAHCAPADWQHQLLLVIVPRHPQRFDEVAQLVQDNGLRLCRRSTALLPSDNALAPSLVTAKAAERVSANRAASVDPSALQSSLQQAQVLLGDSMGEMFAYYAGCDVAFIGGSLLPLGGQNLIEACAVGKPVLIGPSTYNFQVITEEAIAAGAAKRVADARVLLQTAMQVLEDGVLAQAMGESAHQFATRHQGATQLTLALLAPFLEKA